MFKFSKRIRAYKCLYLFISLIYMPCTFFGEIYLQKFIDQKNLNYFMFGSLMALFFVTFMLKFLRSYVKNCLDNDGILEGQRLIFNQSLWHKTKENEGTLLYNLTEDTYKMMPWYTSGKSELTLEVLNVAFMIFLIMFDKFLFNIDCLFLFID